MFSSCSLVSSYFLSSGVISPFTFLKKITITSPLAFFSSF
jgi:hypothetical protein